MFYNIISDTVVYISIGPYQCESISPFLKLAIALLRLIYSLFTIIIFVIVYFCVISSNYPYHLVVDVIGILTHPLDSITVYICSI